MFGNLWVVKTPNSKRELKCHYQKLTQKGNNKHVGSKQFNREKKNIR